MNEVFKYVNSKAYHENEVIEEIIENYYESSMNALIEYIKSNLKNPTEILWNKYAMQNKYLSSKSIAYISNMKFHILCKEIRKDITNINKKII